MSSLTEFLGFYLMYIFPLTAVYLWSLLLHKQRSNFWWTLFYFLMLKWFPQDSNKASGCEENPMSWRLNLPLPVKGVSVCSRLELWQTWYELSGIMPLYQLYLLDLLSVAALTYMIVRVQPPCRRLMVTGWVILVICSVQTKREDQAHGL